MMRRARGIAAVAAAILAIGILAVPAHRAAAGDDDALRPGEGGADIATPGLVASSQAASGADARITAVPSGSQPGIDDFVYDDLLTVGTAAEVCYGGLRTGTLATYHELVNRFGGTPGTMYYCRERYATFERAECNGQIASPVTSPAFWSDCWSNHAQGRAFDIMVGTAGGGYNQARGNAIVNFLLAPDAAGNPSANARRLGVQQILWNNKCWNSGGDRGITSASAMRVCGYGHYDHVHVDLTVDGSEARTSWWGYAPRQDPKLNSLWFGDAQSGAWEWRAMVRFAAVSARAGSYPPRFTKLVRGDWNSDGASNEIFAWNQTNGEFVIYDGATGSSLYTGRASPAVDQFVNGDFDRNGFANDLILFDTETGYGTLWTFVAGGLYGRSDWRWGGGWDKLVALDGNSDGWVDDVFISDNETGVYYVFNYGGGPPVYLTSAQLALGWEDFVAGDLDAQGHLDDLFVRDKDSGFWVVLNWYSQEGVPASWRMAQTGQWLPDWDKFVMGDFDTDGRVDDMYVYDVEGGGWVMMSWHRYVTSYAAISAYVPGLDNFLTGTFG